MNYFVKLLIPLVLGVLAAAINYMMVTAQTKTETFVTVGKPVEAGEMFDLANAKPLGLPQSFRDLSKTIVPFSNRGMVSGRIARRKIEPGDPIFFADFDLEQGKWWALEPGEELFTVELQDVTVDPLLLRVGSYILLRISALEAGKEPEWIGPYRIVSVGSKINNNFSDDRRSFTGNSLSLGIAYHKTRDAELIKQLESFCDRQRTANAKIIAVRLQETRR